METTPGLHRMPPPDLDAVESDPELVARIRSEIERDGPLTFARFMALALYDPVSGYYRAEAARPGRAGDFLTAPEASPVFGRALARHAADIWAALGEPPRFTIVEHGAGTGALAAGLLDELARIGSGLADAVRYRAVEVDPRRLEQLAVRLDGLGLAGRLEGADDAPVTGLVLANEVIDALPTHRVVRRGVGLREIGVAIDGERFVDVEMDASPRLAARLAAEAIELADGQVAEVCLAVDGWVAAAAAGLERGELLLIDYGHPAVELYDPRRRPRGTVMAYLRHRAHEDLYLAVGRQDLTAHVDVTAVERAAATAGLDHLGTTTQGRFLEGLGAGELLVELGAAAVGGPALAAYLEARAALVRMIDPAAMGGFRVMAFGRGVPAEAPLRGIR